MTIYVYSNYNNYYNRIVKYPGDNIEDYPEPVHVQTSYNFVPNDDVNTTLLLGSHVRNYNGDGDYLIVTDELNNIKSRWFIIESVRDRGGQFTLALHRDLVVDYYESIVNSPCFIEKAQLSVDNPLIFNKEDMSFNQIKTSETLLKDATSCPWLVGYYSRSEETLTGTVPFNDIEGEDVIVLSTPITGWEYAKYASIDGTTPSDSFKGEIQSAYYLIQSKSALTRVRYKTEYKTGETECLMGTGSRDTSLNFALNYDRAPFQSGYIENEYKSKLTILESQMYGPEGMPITANYESTIKYFKDLNGKTVLDSNGSYYRISIGTTTNETQTANLSAGALFNTLNSVVEQLKGGYNSKPFTGTPNEHTFVVEANVLNYTLELKNISNTKGVTYSITSDKLITEDAPWNIFAIPYGKINIKDSSDNIILETNADIGLATAMSMLQQHPNQIYDIQMLPYCPFNYDEDGSIIVNNNNEYGKIIKTEEESETLIGVIFNIKRARFTRTLNFNIIGSQSAIQKKLNNECDKWRLSSPNYSNYFDFSVEKNNGVYGFNIDCEYKPFTPYIHINPIFSGLYGYDDNSPRGLVLGGDFSLSSIIDQWEQYQVQNKNFQNIFDRQIQNLEVQQNVQRQQELFQVAAGTVAGASNGAISGAMMSAGNPYAAAAGAVVGGATSLIGGIKDIQLNEILRTEALDFSKDNFGYQLGNIQALPNTIGKISALNNNNKLFPVLEYYTCTETEKNALLNKLAYNGMTTMVIGTIGEYLGNTWEYNGITSKGYVKGKLIRLETENIDNFRIVNAIADEINKGMYI